MINFRKDLQNRITDIIKAAVGPGTDPVNTVKTFDSYLHDVAIEELPFVVVNVRTAERSGDSELGVTYDLYTWTVHVYYLDTETKSGGHDEADARRDNILGRIEKTLEENRRLGNLENVSSDGHREYVFDSSVSAILFDSSGQDEYYSFVSELYFNVYTARN